MTTAVAMLCKQMTGNTLFFFPPLSEVTYSSLLCPASVIFFVRRALFLFFVWTGLTGEFQIARHRLLDRLISLKLQIGGEELCVLRVVPGKFLKFIWRIRTEEKKHEVTACFLYKNITGYQTGGTFLFNKNQLTEGDEARVVGINLIEKRGQVQVRHAQSTAEQSSELFVGDFLVFIRVKQLHERGQKVRFF